ncbi:MAG: hypothetical protein AAB367_04635 [Patescibacteria group bacterium]
MKKSIRTIVALVLALGFVTSMAAAQTAAPTVKGAIDIKFNSRVQLDDGGKPIAGVKDIYTMSLNVTDLLIFGGSVEHLPPIFGGLTGTSEKQTSTLGYNVALQVRNPANLSQTKAVGKFGGTVPIDRRGAYRYQDGNLRIAVEATGKAADFTSAFRGLAVGKAPKGGETLTEKVSQAAVPMYKKVTGGQTAKIVVSNYDRMRYEGLVLAAGPVQSYPETQVSGEALFDYDRSVWFFNGVTMRYQKEGKDVTDRITGNVKWVESPSRATNGEGQYEFDVRVNEPVQAGEAAVFEAAADESAFFATDTTLPSMTGTAKYKDVINDGTVTASTVAIDLTGNNLTPVQVVNLTKLLWLVNIVPMNAE